MPYGYLLPPGGDPNSDEAKRLAAMDLGQANAYANSTPPTQGNITRGVSPALTAPQSTTVNAIDPNTGEPFDPTNPNNTLRQMHPDWYGAGYEPDATSDYSFSSGEVPTDNYAKGFRIRLRDPQGNYVFSKDHSFIAHAIENGWEAVADNGSPLVATQFAGGWLIDGVPINAALTGEMTQEQADALHAAGMWNDNAAGAKITANGGMPAGHNAGAGRVTGSGTEGPTGNTGGGTSGIPGINTTLPDNAKDTYKLLLDAILKRTAGADALSKAGVDFFGQMGRLGDQSAAQRDRFVNELYPGMKDTIGYFMANKDKAEGLSPEGRSALRLQLNEGIPERFNQAAQSMNTELLRRGADTGQMPASGGDIVRGFSPLYAARAGEYSKANRDVILQDEAQKLQSLMANRQLASQAVGQSTGLTSTLGNIYNPSSYYNTGLGGLSAGISGFGAGTQGLGVGAGLAGGLADLEPTSFGNLLKASLIGTGSQALTDILKDPSKWKGLLDFFKSLGGIFTGGGYDPSGPNSGTKPPEDTPINQGGAGSPQPV